MAATMHRMPLVLGQWALLMIACGIAFVLSELWLFAAITLIEALPEHPVVAGGALLLFCGFVYLCVRGARTTWSKVLNYLSRAVLVLLSAIAAVGAVELVGVGLISLGIAGWRSSLDDYQWLAGGVLLAALAAAGIKHAFGWRVRYWVMLLGTGVAVVLATAGAGISMLLF
jgi:hypothetical protein